MQCANNNTKMLILSHHAPHRSSHHNLQNPRQRHRDLLFHKTSKHHQGPASPLHHLNHHYHIIESQWKQSQFVLQASFAGHGRRGWNLHIRARVPPTDTYGRPWAVSGGRKQTTTFYFVRLSFYPMGILSTGETMGPY